MNNKNIVYGRIHIKKKHPKEFRITKNVLDLLIKKEAVSKLSSKPQIDYGRNEDLSKSTK